MQFSLIRKFQCLMQTRIMLKFKIREKHSEEILRLFMLISNWYLNMVSLSTDQVHVEEIWLSFHRLKSKENKEESAWNEKNHFWFTISKRMDPKKFFFFAGDLIFGFIQERKNILGSGGLIIVHERNLPWITGEKCIYSF